MGLTKTALSRPIFILMLMLSAFLLGTICYNGMRKEQNPEVNFGVVTVITTYPGAGPDDINELISRKVEQAVSGVNGVREVTSTAQEGVSVVSVQLELGVDVDTASNDVRSKMDSIINDLPKDALKPQVIKFDNSAQPVLTLAVASNRLTSAQLRDLIDDKIVDKFAQIPGVAGASVQGGDVREIEVQVKKDKLLAYGLGIADIQRAVASGSVNSPAGRIVTGPTEYTVRVKNDYEKPEQIRDMIISVSDPKSFGGKPRSVRLADVADIKDTVEERTSYSKLNGKDTVSIAISKSRDGNAVEITNTANDIIKQVQEQYKADNLTIIKTFEQAKIISTSLEDLRFALYFGILLVAIIVFIFLHDIRGTIIVAIAIPTSIFATFIAMKMFGFTINNMSMLSLSLAIGVLVDDAIVVLENIFRHLRMGEDPRDAAINGRSEIGLAALAITFADVVVFLPIAFMGGIVGQFFKPLALGFVMATLFSLFVSFTVTPLLASRWFKKGEDMEHPKGRFAQWFERRFASLQESYRRGLEWSLNHRWFVFIAGNVVLLAVFAFIAGTGVAPKVPLGATGDDAIAAKYGIPGAIAAAIPMFMATIVVGLLAMGARRYNELSYRTRSTISIVSIAPAIFIATKLGAINPMLLPLGLAIGWLVSVGLIGAAISIFTRPARLVLVGQALLFALAFPVFSFVGYAYANFYKHEQVFKFGFLPDTDQGQVIAAIELAPGSSLAETERVVQRVEKTFMDDPDVHYVVSNVGSQGFGGFGGGSSGSNYAQVQATLYDKQAFLDRFKKQTEKLRLKRSATSVAADMTYRIGKVPGATVKISAGSGFGFGSAVQLSFTSDDRAKLIKTVERVRDGLASGIIPGVINPDISSKPGKPELRVVPDRTALADLGIDAATVGAAIRTAYQGDDSTKMRVNGREYTVRVMLDRADRDNQSVLTQVPVRFVQGNPVYLSQVSKIETAPGIDKITRRSRAEEISVTADILPGYANGSVNQQVGAWIKKENLVPEGVNFRPLGQADAQAREGVYMIGALFLGLILVYMLLASLYNNLLYPLIIQMAQPQAMVGALMALMITDKAFNLVAFIGIVTLIGLVGKNAILLVDYTNTLRARGEDRHQALVDAGPTRLRPILMTTLALILGMLPVALAIGRGSEFRDTIGITVIGGISLSTMLTLFVIPCSYTIFDDFSNWLGVVVRRFFGMFRRRKPDAVVVHDELGDPTAADPEPALA